MSMIRETNEKTFNEIYQDADTFYKESSEYGFNQSIDEDATKTIFYLLTAKYGDCTTLGFTNETRWKMKLFMIIWEFGSEWVRKVNLTDDMRKVTTDEAMDGSKVLVNHSKNPQNKPTTEELDYIDDQNATKYKKSKIEALEILYSSSHSEFTNAFINRFAVLFNPVLLPSDPLYVYGGDN